MKHWLQKLTKHNKMFNLTHDIIQHGGFYGKTGVGQRDIHSRSEGGSTCESVGFVEDLDGQRDRAEPAERDGDVEQDGVVAGDARVD